MSFPRALKREGTAGIYASFQLSTTKMLILGLQLFTILSFALAQDSNNARDDAVGNLPICAVGLICDLSFFC